MTDAADRIPVDEQYLRALGRATYNFAYLERGIIWLGEIIQPGFLETSKKRTARKIAKKFRTAVGKRPNDTMDLQAIIDLASSFEKIVMDCNRLMHGNPFTAKGGSQWLRYDGRHGLKTWTPELICEFASQSAKAGIEASRLLHNDRFNNSERQRYGQ